VGPRRAGDPAQLVAASDRIRADLGWTPRHTDLTGIVRDAWEVARSRA
jgi:UDP-glucose 4-epimerase